MATTKYGIKSLKKDFPNDDKCLDFIFDARHSRKCSCGGTYKRVSGRKQYQCSKCRFQIAPTAGTIFHKSDTPLTIWFHALLVFSNAKSGISAKYLQRELEVTYKCAWRILSLIRKALEQDKTHLSGDVEMDIAYLGGIGKAGKNNEKLSQVMKAKSIVVAAVERGGKMRALLADDAGADTHRRFIARNILATRTTRLMTDGSNRYKNAIAPEKRHSVDHHIGEYVRGDIHINTVETFFAHLKRSIRGTFKGVSKKHLQSYLDGFVFHYNNRNSDSERFGVLLGSVLRVAR